MNIEKIEFKDASFAYVQGSEVLSNLSLNIFKSETIFVFGNSGGGKTTFLKLAEGLIAPINGDVIINDKLSLKKASKPELMNYHSHSAFIFQDSGLINNMNAYDNLALYLRYSTTKKEKEIKDIVVPVMQKLGILNHQNSLPGQLSRAEKKLVSIARAMIINPEMYIYDFPFEGLDYFYINKIKSIIIEQKQRKRTLLISDNHLDFSFEVADKILVLYEGKTLFFDSPHKLLQFDHPFIKELLEHKRLWGNIMAYKFKSMEKIVGIFIVFAILTFLSFLLMIGRGKNLFVKKNFYYTYFSKGEGISKGLKVMFNGIAVGKVTDIQLNKDNRVYVKFFVLREYSDRVKTTSVVTFSKSLIGAGTMRITKGLVGSRVLPNDTYICSSDSQKGKEYLARQQSSPEGIDKTLANVNELTEMLKDPNGALALTLINLQKLSDNLNKITANIANNNDRIDDILISLQETLDNLVVVSKNLKHNRLLGGHPEKKKNQLINETK